MRPKKRKGKFALASLLFVFVALFLSRHHLTAISIEAFFRYASKEKMVYDSRDWENGRLVYKGLSIGEGLHCDRAEIEFRFNWSPFYIEPRIVLDSPVFTLNSEKSSSTLLAGLLPSRFFGIKLTVDHGLIEIKNSGEECRLTCSLVSGEGRDKIGTFFLYDESTEMMYPLATCEVATDGKQILVEGDLVAANVSRLVEFAAFFHPELSEGWEEIQGEIEVHGKGIVLKDFTIKELAADVEVRKALLTNSLLGMHFRGDNLHAELNYPLGNEEGPFWRQMGAAVSIDNAEMLLFQPLIEKELGIVDCSGHLNFRPEIEPAIHLQGSVLYKEATFPFELAGKGLIHEDKSFWLECDTKLGAAEAKVSFCSPKTGAFVVQANLHRVDQEIVEVIRETTALLYPAIHDLHFTCGNFEGEITAWVDGGKLEKLQFEKLTAHEFYLEGEKAQGFVGQLIGECLLEHQGTWKVSSLNLDLKEVAGKFEKWQLENFDSHLEVFGGVFRNSWGKGSILDTPVQISCHGTWEDAEFHLQTAFKASQISKICTDAVISVDSICRREGENWQISGLINELYFDLELSSAFSLKSGSFQCEHFSPQTFISNIAGDLDLSGTLTPSKIECHVQGNHVIYDDSLINCEIPILSRGYFSYDIAEEKFKATIPLKKSRLLEKERQVVLEDVDGVFQLLGSKDEAHIVADSMEGSIQSPVQGKFWCGKNGFHLLAHNSSLDWRIKASLSDLEIPLNSSAKISNLGFDLDFDSSAKICAVTNAIGQLEAHETYPFSSNLLWNLSKKQCEFEIEGEGMKFAGLAKEVKTGQWQFLLSEESKFSGAVAHLIVRAPGSYSFDVEWDDFSAKATVEDKILYEVKWKEVRMKGDAAYKDDLSWTIQSVEGLPFPIEGSGRLAFSPSLEMQDFHLKADDIQISSDHLKMKGESKATFSFESFKGFCTVNVAWPQISLKGIVEEGSYPLADSSVKAKQITGLYEPPFIYLGVQAAYRDLPFQISLKVDPQFAGIVKIQNPQKEELVFKCGPQMKWETADGTLSGLELHLKSYTSGFRGSMNITDGGLASQLLPKEFEFIKELKEIRSEVEFSSKLASIKNLTMNDESGSLAIKEIRCEKSKDGKWLVEIPLLKAQNFKPKDKLKPFVLRNFVLSNIKGILGDFSSFRGRGSLNFSNVFKREASLFDIPLDMIKNLGLDFDLLTPISGEIDVQLKDGKILFTELKNSFSEGKRSQFYLAEGPSYVDLNGNLNINIRMKQEAVLKIAEPFVIAIRGTFEKPKYSLK